ncbi:sugar transferase [Actinopolyspora mortivallis]|uniref:Bacterial sugar transferase domain-containing protein n=1 Tax=Actinopolyspora mortivallis TaxID=33906 RepID=A0A2T0GT98_ACTMO|nr:sugar transferase [Actinopolyspora mortivallis]PRW62329.1 hypothetical protein CEP50_16120 [Actinopolyspora mortivallis]
MTRQLPRRDVGGDDTARPGTETTWSHRPEVPLPGRWVRLLPRRLLLGTDVLALCAVLPWLGVGAVAALVHSCGVLVVLSVRGAHRLRLCARVSDEFGHVVLASALSLVPLAPGLGPVRTAVLGGGVTGALCGARLLVSGVLSTLRARGRLVETVLVVGGSDAAGEILGALGRHPEFGLRPVGVRHRGSTPENGPGIAEPAELEGLVRRYGATRVILCPESSEADELVDAVRRCRRLSVDFCVLPRLPDLGLAVPKATLDEVWGIPLLPLRVGARTVGARSTKRVCDLVLAVPLLVAVTPLLAVLAALVRHSGGGSPLFRQERVGRDGGLVLVTKLRTVLAVDEHTGWRPLPEQCGRLGTWLRRTHLDELPQLWDVVRGRLSLVGPRPERPYYAVRFSAEIPHYADRHRVTGGVTGWAQVNGLHGDTSIAERARFDNHYIEYWTPWTDLVVLVRTAGVLAGFGQGHNEHEEAGSASTTRDHGFGCRWCRTAVVRTGAAQQTRL